MDLENHVILPREEFSDLRDAYWERQPIAPGERVAQSLQSTVFLATFAAAVTAGAWGWAKALDWLEERNFQRRVRENQTAAAVS